MNLNQKESRLASDVVSTGVRFVYFTSGEAGLPLPLIHCINAAASVAEVEALRAHYAASRRVHRIDLPIRRVRPVGPTHTPASGGCPHDGRT